VILNSGTLSLDPSTPASSTPTSGVVTSGPLGTGSLTINGGTFIPSSANTNEIANNIVANAVPSAIAVGGTSSLNGAISGPGGIRKGSSGTLFLNGANTYAGDTQIAGGSIIVGSDAPSGANGALGNSTGTVTLGEVGSGTGSFRLLTGGAFNIGRNVDAIDPTGTVTGSAAIGGVSTSSSTFSGLVTFARNLSVVQNTDGGTLNVTGGLKGTTAVATTLTFGSNLAILGVTAPNFFLGDINVNSSITETSGGPVSVAVTGGSVTYATGNTNSYSGTTAVSAGKLIINGTHTGAGAYSVSAGATLGGNGSIITAANAGVGVSGKLSPGASAGLLSMDLGTGALDISTAVNAVNSQSMLFELDTPSTSDQVLLSNATSSLNIGGGTLEFDDFAFTALGGFGPGTYVLFDTSSLITGTLGSNLSGPIGALSASIGLADGGQDIVLNVVPEPMSGVLSGIGLLGFAIAASRFKRSTTSLTN
jgi:autotransporter-associated beta strand protein